VGRQKRSLGSVVPQFDPGTKSISGRLLAPRKRRWPQLRRGEDLHAGRCEEADLCAVQCKQAYAGRRGEHTDMAHRVARWTFLVATLFFVPPAFAQTDNMPPPVEGSSRAGEPPMQPSMQGGPLPARGGGGLRVACGPDIARLCRGVPAGGGRIVQCLITRPGALSPMCRAHLRRGNPAGVAQTSPPPHTKTTLQASCGPDAKLFCGGVPSENQGVVKCLVSHRSELSAACKKYLQDAHAEGSEPPPRSSNLPPGRSEPPPAAPPGNE
jgi:hypothetical protein